MSAWKLSHCVLAIGLAGSASAGVIVDNFSGGPYQNGTAIGNNASNGSARAYQAIGLDILGNNLQFTSMQTIFDNSDTQSSRVVSGGIYSDNGGNPFSLLAAFNLITIPAQAQDVTLTSTAAVQLAANTRYWFVLTGPVAAQGVLPNWQTNQANTAPTASAFASVAGYRSSTNNMSSWSASTVSNQVRINADVDFSVQVVPEPSTFVLAGAALLLIARRAVR